VWSFLKAGGLIPMGLILLLGGAGLLAAFVFAIRGERRLLGFLRSISAAILFATLSGTCAGVGSTLHAVSDVYERGEPYTFHGQPVLPQELLAGGLSESSSSGILGFSVLALIAMLSAVGQRRLAEKSDPR
jgi:hypothetical protein